MHRTSARARFAIGLALGVSGSSARADDFVTLPYPGVTHIHRVEPGLDAHVVTVDTAGGNIEILGTPSTRRGMTVSRFAREYDAHIAINANFYDRGVCGLAVSDREAWLNAYDEYCHASVAFGRREGQWRAAVFDSTGWYRQNPIAWAETVVTGWPLLLWQGTIVRQASEPRGMYRPNPRTAIGVAADGHTLVIVVADGRRMASPGPTSLELVPLLEEFGARDAINLDGGGSSTLYIDAEGGVVNRPADGFQRAVLNHLGFRIVGAAWAGTASP